MSILKRILKFLSEHFEKDQDFAPWPIDDAESEADWLALRAEEKVREAAKKASPR